MPNIVTNMKLANLKLFGLLALIAACLIATGCSNQQLDQAVSVYNKAKADEVVLKTSIAALQAQAATQPSEQRIAKQLAAAQKKLEEVEAFLPLADLAVQVLQANRLGPATMPGQ